ncbi:MAG TPA: hypothetical protein DDW23_01450, partial [Planctomycetes bacterium]|nr:hypothetical protein [Planctomycetota bacterium]
GLRALMASPLRANLMKDLPEGTQKNIEKIALIKGVTSAAGLGRLFSITIAVALLITATAPVQDATKAPLWIGIAIVAGLLLEGVPALVERGRGIRTLVLFIPLLKAVAFVLRPFTIVLGNIVESISTDTEKEKNGSGLAEELLDVAREAEREEELDEGERRMIERVMELPDTDAAEVMTPRTELKAIPIESSLAEALALSRQTGFSRIPAYREDLDHVEGIFYVKDALARGLDQGALESTNVGSQLREAFVVPETLRVPALLEEMRKRRVHMAVAVDEYGGTAGVVTIEDLLEEIVGEIRDEHDISEIDQIFEQNKDGSLVVDGRLEVDQLNDLLKSSLPEDEDYDTVAGLICERLGHIPSPGEKLSYQNLLFEVLEADERRVHKVRIRPEKKETEAA